MFVALLMIATIGIFSCEEEKPLCERNQFGTVTVVNNTGKQLYVDVTEGNDQGSYYGGDLVSSGASKRYTVSPGNVTIWGIYPADRQAGYAWSYKDHYVNQCDEYKYTWTSKKKGADVIIEIDENGNVNDEFKDTKGLRNQ